MDKITILVDNMPAGYVYFKIKSEKLFKVLESFKINKNLYMHH